MKRLLAILLTAVAVEAGAASKFGTATTNTTFADATDVTNLSNLYQNAYTMTNAGWTMTLRFVAGSPEYDFSGEYFKDPTNEYQYWHTALTFRVTSTNFLRDLWAVNKADNNETVAYYSSSESGIFTGEYQSVYDVTNMASFMTNGYTGLPVDWYVKDRSHATESSNTVHGGFIRVAYDWATNAYSLAQTAFGWGNHATNGYVTASVTNGLVGAPTFQAFTGTVLTAESDPVWTAVSNTVTQGAAAGSAHAVSEHGVSFFGGFFGGTGSASGGGGAVGNNASTTRGGGAVGNNASTTDGGAIGFATKTSEGFAGGMGALATVDGAYVSEGINAVQLGQGANTNPYSFQIYDYPLLQPDGTIPLPRMANVTNGAALGETALQPASTNGWTVTSHDGLVPTNRTITVNGATGTLDSNVTFTVTGSTDAPAWIAATNTDLAITLTNDLERPQYLYATGAVSLAFAGLRTPQPFYLVVRGPDSLAFPSGTHFVGGASWQTNQANHFIVWQYTSNLYVNPVTTSTEE